MSGPTGPADEAPDRGEGDEGGSGGGDGGERQPEPDVNSGVLRVFGRQLKRFRLRAGLERPEFGAVTGYSVSTIAAYEQGRRVPPPRFIDQADEVLDAGGVLQEMKEEVARAQYPAFFRDVARLEGEAVELHVYANQAVPGLLQTEEYARAVFGMWRPLLDKEVIDQRVTARLARQRIFARRPMPTISFVIEEATLRRPLGGEDVWRGQLGQVLRVGRYRNVELQVMPTQRQEHAGLGGQFTLIETREGRRIAYVEAHKESRLYTERSPVRELEEQYGLLRAQGLPPWESLAFVEKLLGER
ncbi:helix-turn-helix domain-containing protein [Streptomyces sudanensis]|uniref:helix-turn-helix domain-containing protein n=1 Tax=Streptomyces sudanensis TaxID=436397 RepID=UPI0020CC52F6|nr:helix-turn-helix transcriptional regulator [Streptomyces sudanensis]MCP9986096.1 helix-turn-helix domain-containing protein [Streptomyces sudanensis]